MSERHGNRSGPLSPRRFDYSDLLVVVTSTLFGVAHAIASGLDALDDTARAHANWRRDRIDWTDETIKEIERL